MLARLWRNAMIEGYHAIFGAYGFWLPNDPCGSWSDFVGSWELFRYGPATKTQERQSLAYRPHDAALRLATKNALNRPPVQFTGQQALTVALGFKNYFERSKRPVCACAVLPDHVHLVVGSGHINVEQLVIQLKREATQNLIERGIDPFGNLLDNRGRIPKCFAQGEWKVYLDPDDIPRAIR
jgi:hypothetical protein